MNSSSIGLGVNCTEERNVTSIGRSDAEDEIDDDHDEILFFTHSSVKQSNRTERAVEEQRDGAAAVHPAKFGSETGTSYGFRAGSVIGAEADAIDIAGSRAADLDGKETLLDDSFERSLIRGRSWSRSSNKSQSKSSNSSRPSSRDRIRKYSRSRSVSLTPPPSDLPFLSHDEYDKTTQEHRLSPGPNTSSKPDSGIVVISSSDDDDSQSSIIEVDYGASRQNKNNNRILRSQSARSRHIDYAKIDSNNSDDEYQSARSGNDSDTGHNNDYAENHFLYAQEDTDSDYHEELPTWSSEKRNLYSVEQENSQPKRKADFPPTTPSVPRTFGRNDARQRLKADFDTSDLSIEPSSQPILNLKRGKATDKRGSNILNSGALRSKSLVVESPSKNELKKSESEVITITVSGSELGWGPTKAPADWCRIREYRMLANQNMRVVKYHFCSALFKTPLPLDEYTLVYKETRVFDSATPRSLGFEEKRQGIQQQKPENMQQWRQQWASERQQRQSEQPLQPDERPSLVIMTKKDFSQWKTDRQRQRERELLNDDLASDEHRMSDSIEFEDFSTRRAVIKTTDRTVNESGDENWQASAGVISKADYNNQEYYDSSIFGQSLEKLRLSVKCQNIGEMTVEIDDDKTYRDIWNEFAEKFSLGDVIWKILLPDGHTAAMDSKVMDCDDIEDEDMIEIVLK